MRCLTIKQRLQLRRHSEHSLECALRWKEWRRVKRGGAPSQKVELFADGQRVRVNARERMPMPRIFCLDENIDETLQFLDRMRTLILGQAVEYKRREEAQRQREMRSANRRQPKRRRPPLRSYFDFTTLRKITPTAALVLAALYDRRKTITGFRPFTVDERLWNRDVLRVLRSVGFHELLEMLPERRDDDTGGQAIRILKFLSGQLVEGQDLGKLQEALVEFLPDEDERERLLYAEPYAGMIEAA